MMWWFVHPHVNILVDAPVWCTIIWRQNIDRWRCNGPQEPLQRYHGQGIGQYHCWMRWRQRIGWLVAPTGVECHRRGSSDVRRPMVKLYSSRLRGSSPVEQIEGTLGLVSTRAAVDLFHRRAIIGSAASWALPSIGWWRVLSWRVCETERGRPESS